ncbi:hypothetical protein AB0886_05160 [Streptomyces sp. NPDC024062]|uniref:hypothetical protein n=1 Tax=unclassified Streptomyces TaxID=2593676 RepID=UPI003439E4F4
MDTSTETGSSSPGGLRDNIGRPYVTDTQTGTVAVFMTGDRASAYVRPVHGGPEWEVDPSRLRPATPAEIRAAQ